VAAAITCTYKVFTTRIHCDVGCLTMDVMHRGVQLGFDIEVNDFVHHRHVMADTIALMLIPIVHGKGFWLDWMEGTLSTIECIARS